MEGGYLISDGDRVVDCSAAAGRIVGALLGEGDSAGVVGTRTSAVFEAAGLDGRRGEFSAVVDGERHHFEVRSTPLEDDGADVGDLVVFTDVTDRVRAREELARERAEFDALFQGLADPVVKVHVENGRPIVRRVNLAFEETFGYDEGDLRGESLDDHIVPPDHEDQAVAITREAADGGVIKQEVVRGARDGPRQFLLRTVATGESSVYGFYTDVTDQRRRQRELERKNERLEAFASVVSHDLRNPIAVARGYLQGAREADDPASELDELETSLDRIEAIVEDVLALAREGDDVSHPDPVVLSEVAEAAWRNVDTADATLSADPMELRADPDRLLQLFENLFRNCVEHGSTDGRPADDTAIERAGDDPAVVVASLPDDRGFFVADDGPGIPEARREDVLEHGYTTAETGTGLGLAIVQRIARAHGWTVAVAESETGGARFEFRFDARSAPETGGPASGGDAASTGPDPSTHS